MLIVLIERSNMFYQLVRLNIDQCVQNVIDVCDYKIDLIDLRRRNIIVWIIY
jgi:hypothetical protein